MLLASACKLATSASPIGRRLRAVTKHFLNAGLVRNADQKRFGSYVLDTVRFHDSRLAEVVLVALTYLTTYVALSKTSLQSGSTWFVPLQAPAFPWPVTTMH